MAAAKALTTFLFGFHPVEEALRSGGRPVGTVYVGRGRQGSRTSRIVELARERGCRIRFVEGRALERLVPGKPHQGVVAEVAAKESRDLEEILAELEPLPKATLLVLDGVQDPHNLGAVIRSCSLTSAAAVVLPKDRTVGLTPAVEKTSSGALQHVDVVRVVNLASALKKMKEAGFWVLGADSSGEVELPEADLGGKTVIVFGGEHKGLRRLTREKCDLLVRIPSTGAVDSYNLSVAAGIFLFQAYLQRR